jgi:hypothetical protein
MWATTDTVLDVWSDTVRAFIVAEKLPELTINPCPSLFAGAISVLVFIGVRNAVYAFLTRWTVAGTAKAVTCAAVDRTSDPFPT